MNFKVCMFDQMPPWDSLPVAKLSYFPDSTDINQNIFGQGRLCYVAGTGLVVRLWLFEAPPYHKDSLLTLTFVGANGPLQVFFMQGEQAAYFSSEADRGSLVVDSFAGEDLQGEYWGGQFVLDDYFLQKQLGKGQIAPNKIIRGNLMSRAYTVGRLFPDEYGEFLLVNY